MRKKNLIIYFLIFLIVILLANYLLTLSGIVAIPNIAALDYYSIIHALSTGGTAFFILAYTYDNIKLRKIALSLLFASIIIWEIIENTLLRGTRFSGQESLANSGMDILIGVISMAAIIYFYTRNERRRKSDSRIGNKG